MANEASIVIPVEMDDKQAKAELNRLNREMLKLQQQMAANQDRKSTISEQLKEAQAQAKETRQDIIDVNAAIRENQNVINSYSGGGVSEKEYADAQSALRQLSNEQTYLNAKLKEEEAAVARIFLQETQIDGKLREQNAQYDFMKSQAGEIQKRLINAASEGMNKLRRETDKASGSFKKGLSNILKYAFGIRSLFVLVNRIRSGIKDSIKTFTEQDEETKASINGLKSSLATLKGSWGAAFAPIINAVAPLLQTLIGWLTSAANAISRFLSILGGKSTYKRAVANQNALSDSISATGSAAEKAGKQLAGFDELTRLDDNSGSSGGSGGSAAKDVEYIDEIIDKDSFGSRISTTIKDVLFDWKNLTPEKIAEKCFAAMPTAIGILTGATIGGLPGAIIGGLVGLTLGILSDNIIFDHDGKLSEDEILTMVQTALSALGFAAIGLAVGGPVGAALGATVGLGLSLGLKVLFKDGDNPVSKFVNEYLSDQAIIGYIKKYLNWANVKRFFWDNGLKLMLDEILSLFGLSVDNFGNDFQAKIDGVKEKWNDFTGWLKVKWDDLKSWWQGLSLGSFDFKTPHLEVAWEALADNSVLAKLLGITAIPHLSVKWYAKGGIVDGATLIGAGEAGKEAIIPLERNTEWITKVAKQISEMLFYNNVFDRIADQVAKIPDALDRYAVAMNNIPLPAMASGSVVPPMISVSAFDTEWGNNILGKLNELSDRLQALSDRDFVGHSTIDIDRRKVGEVVTRYQREQERAGR